MKLTRLCRPRAGVRVEVFDALGRVGCGEVFPLPGRSSESAQEVMAALATLNPATPDDTADVAAAIVTLVGGAAFALESALLDLLAQRQSRPVWSLLAPGRARPADVVYNALIDTDDPVKAADLARAHLQRGVHTLKVKLGGDLLVAAAVRAAAPKASLRLDVNGAWSLTEAPSRLRAVVDLNPEYVEQPVSPEDLLRLGRAPVPLAADESLALEGGVEQVLRGGCCEVLVLKPAILGGAQRCRDIARQAGAVGVDVVVTHSRDGPVALEAARQLAWSLDRPRACGLM